MYASVNDLEKYLDITFEDTTTAITLLESATASINAYLGIDSILAEEHEELIDVRGVIDNENGYNLYLKNKPVSKVIEINGTEITDEDYYIVRKRQLILPKHYLYNNLSYDKHFVKVKYVAGYDKVPEDIKTVCVFLASTIFLTRNYTGITNYRLGDESISIGTQRFMFDSPFVSETLRKYKNIYIPY